MIKVFFEKLNITPEVEIELYDSISRIPFTLKIGPPTLYAETIYGRNLCGGDFIEYKFNKTTKDLYKITLVCIQNETVENVKNINEAISKKDDFYQCFIDKEVSDLETSFPTKIFRDDKSICVNWGIQDSNIEYFPLTTNFLVGINSDSYLVSVILTNLRKEDLLDIFGF